MMDLSVKGSGSEDLTNEKRCSDCQTTKTPLWRGGPAGPKRSKSIEKHRKLGEEEQAAVLLMALSCGSLYV
ncbi:hypothetical protein C5167_015120 [Papaver somniferum]|uniref:GATA-type domain-containing protein n=1 Tax=Papaver somniferum TaxID=3469 RepID=A0A4Y7J9H6_PAPSO|nr:hypothetical protein C5167_015120 [Papaver somniferum]